MIQLRTLGALDLRRDGAEVRALLAQPKRLAVLAYLAAASPRGFHSRDTLLGLFWPEADQERARNALRQSLHHIRRALGESAVVGRGDREVGVDAAELWCDAAAFDEAMEAGRWEDALALYQGDFLPGLFVQEAPEAERWVEDERARRRRLAVDAAWRLADRDEGAGSPALAARWARRAQALEPLDEGSFRRLFALLERSGDAAGALEAYGEFARRLEADYGIQPSAETGELVKALRARGAAGTPGLQDAPASGAARHPSSAGRTDSPPGAPPDAKSTDDAPDERHRSSAPRTDSFRGPPPVGEATPAPSPSRQRFPVRVAALVTGLAVLAAGLGLAARGRGAGERPAADATPSIAVLPFVNMSGVAANDFFSDGLSEELLNVLAQVPGLHVAARTSSFSFKGRSVPVDSIARVLHVGHVLEGSVRQSGGRVRITAQLIDASTGYHVWSGTFDREVRDVFAVQDSISRVIVETLRPRLAAGGDDPGTIPLALPAPRTAPDTAAYVATLKGWRAFRQNTREGYEAAVGHFQQAIARDPRYARAYAGLATVRMWQGSFAYVPQDSAYAESERLARRALAFDPRAFEAELVLGRIAEVRERDMAAAERHFARAIAINPSDARAYSRRAVLLARLGRPADAERSALRATDLDPASPAVWSDLAGLYSELNRMPEAERALRAALTLDPGHPILLGLLATNLTTQHRYAAAESAIVLARRRVPDDAQLMGRHAYVLANVGRGAQARVLLDSADRAGASPIDLAATWEVLGDRDRALGLLERGVRARDDRATALLDSTLFLTLQSDPRMRALRALVRQRAAETGS